MHKEKGLILSIYVDDFKMGGIKDNIAPMWKELRKHVDLDPPVNLRNNVYLGMKQSSCPISQEIVQGQNELFKEIFGSRTYDYQGIEKPTTDSKKEGGSPDGLSKNAQRRQRKRAGEAVLKDSSAGRNAWPDPKSCSGKQDFLGISMILQVTQPTVLPDTWSFRERNFLT